LDIFSCVIENAFYPRCLKKIKLRKESQSLITEPGIKFCLNDSCHEFLL